MSRSSDDIKNRQEEEPYSSNTMKNNILLSINNSYLKINEIALKYQEMENQENETKNSGETKINLDNSISSNENFSLLNEHINAIRSEIINSFVMLRNGEDKNRYGQDEDRLFAESLSEELINKLMNLTTEEIGKILYATNLQIGKNCDKNFDGAVYTSVTYLAKQKNLYINHIGDCVAIIIKWIKEKNQFEIKQINQIHHLNNQTEKIRLSLAKTMGGHYLQHATTFELNGDTYEVINQLTPTRSIGDAKYPDHLGGQSKMKGSGLKYAGDLGTTTIDDSEITFLLLSTDGLFDLINLLVLQEFINKEITLNDFNDEKKLEDKMKQLMKEAIKQFSSLGGDLKRIDNISFILTNFKKSFIALAVDGHGCYIDDYDKNTNAPIRPRKPPVTAEYIATQYMIIFKEKLNQYLDNTDQFETTLNNLKKDEIEFSTIKNPKEPIQYIIASSSDEENDFEKMENNMGEEEEEDDEEQNEIEALGLSSDEKKLTSYVGQNRNPFCQFLGKSKKRKPNNEKNETPSKHSNYQTSFSSY